MPRPPKPAAEHLTGRFEVRATAAEVARYRRAARADGAASLADWTRRMLGLAADAALAAARSRPTRRR